MRFWNFAFLLFEIFLLLLGQVSVGHSADWHVLSQAAEAQIDSASDIGVPEIVEEPLVTGVSDSSEESEPGEENLSKGPELGEESLSKGPELGEGELLDASAFKEPKTAETPAFEETNSLKAPVSKEQGTPEKETIPETDGQSELDLALHVPSDLDEIPSLEGSTDAPSKELKRSNGLKNSTASSILKTNTPQSTQAPRQKTASGLLIAQAEPESVVKETLKPDLISSEERKQLMEDLKKHSAILQAQAKVVKLVAKILEPSVVFIKSDMIKRGARGERIKHHDEGSGIIVCRKEKFYVLTNHHVIKDALSENIEIHLYDNRITHPVRIWFDEETDIAVLEMQETDLIPATLGDSNLMDIGDFVLAFGSPFGLERSVTFGIISAKGRRAINLAANVNLQDFLQTDAAINPGNSGGPLVNLNAEVIAMNTAIASNSGMNAGIAFSIPIRMVMLIADQLIVYGKARRAYLGVTLDAKFTPQQAKKMGLPSGNGARVLEVEPRSPASRANFTEGDVILKFNGAAVEDEKHLYNLVNLTEIGKEIPVTVYRDGKVYKINIRLQER